MPDTPIRDQQHLLKGLAIMAFAMMILPCMDGIAKYLSTMQSMSPGQVAFYRFFFQLVLTVPLLLTVEGAKAFRARRPWMNLLRGALHAAATLLFFQPSNTCRWPMSLRSISLNRSCSRRSWRFF